MAESARLQFDVPPKIYISVTSSKLIRLLKSHSVKGAEELQSNNKLHPAALLLSIG